MNQWVPLERNLYGHPLAGLPCEGKLELILLKQNGKIFLTQSTLRLGKYN